VSGSRRDQEPAPAARSGLAAHSPLAARSPMAVESRRARAHGR
jgi:hypothetical protein